MKVVAVSGVPGTGKTTLSRKLSKKLNFYYLDVNKLISNNKLYEGYDKKRKTKIVDIKKLNKSLIKEIKSLKNNTNQIKRFNGAIIDSHLSHYLPRRYADFCIVTKCEIKELSKRLKKKKFHKNKIQENLQAEIFDVCYSEAVRRKHKVIAVDTTKGFNINKIAKQMKYKC